MVPMVRGASFSTALKRFFEKNRPDQVAELSGSSAKIQLTKKISSRIDITIDFKDFGIGIENKP